MEYTHALHYEHPDKDIPYHYDALYVNHGFGASCLSWLPALEGLVRTAKAKFGLGHDACGFGLTDRLDEYLSLFTLQGSANLGRTLLQQQQMNDEPPSRVLLMGHSFGTFTTLCMALDMDEAIETDIVLVNPALGFQKEKATDHPKIAAVTTESSKPWFERAWLDVPMAYCLKRYVGRPHAWKIGLKKAWGDPSKVSETDILRFEWPYIIRGWEKGLTSLARALFLPLKMTEYECMQRVLQLPNTTVSVIASTADPSIPIEQLRKFLGDFPSVKVVELAGLGHDIHEENVELFLTTVGYILRARQ